MHFIDPCAISFEAWKAALQPGFRFDYGEDGGIQLTVEVERVTRGPMIRLWLLVVDDTNSSHHRLRTGNAFRCCHVEHEEPYAAFRVFAEGYFGRLAAWRKEICGRVASQDQRGICRFIDSHGMLFSRPAGDREN
jgi:hypothetical protein